MRLVLIGLAAAAFVIANTPLRLVAQVQTTHSSTQPAVPAASSPEQRTVTVPGGTSVIVQLVDKISSGTANVGDTFALRTTQDVAIDNWVVIPKGASGQGSVLSVDRAGSHGHAGTMGIQVDWIFAGDGEKIHLSSQRKTEEGENKTGVSNTMTIISWAFLGLPGLFVHNWVKGHDIELDGTHPLQAYVADTVHVVSSTRSGTESGFAH